MFCFCFFRSTKLFSFSANFKKNLSPSLCVVVWGPPRPQLLRREVSRGEEGGDFFKDNTNSFWRCLWGGGTFFHLLLTTMSATRRPGDWDCPKCGHLVFKSKNECFKCGHVKNGGGGGGRARRDDWECPDCGYDVFGSNSECPECGKWRPKESAQRRPGDWDCPSCGEMVFASKKRCGLCNRGVRPDTTASASTTERREGDWECAACGYADNFARRPTCFKCDKPKGWEVPEDGPGACTICLSAPTDTVLQACGHACMCRNCATQAQGTCPMCRKPFVPDQVIPMYMA
jgi:hypothetical protein